MTVVVQKYGGSSVADVEKLGRVADRIVSTRREGNDVVVVVSAMGKATDGLLALGRDAATIGVPVPHDPPRRELDMLVSTGERVSMALLSIAIQARGFDAISFTGSQSGIITTGRHFDARIIEVRPFRIKDELASGKIVIVAGYQGVSLKKEITTLGRGGSDTTAVALAAALGADRCEIYSDVDGVYSGDPRIVDEPIHFPTMDLGFLQEMAEGGAKVINAQAVEWARRSNITLVARRTGDAPDQAARETLASEATGQSSGEADVYARAVVALRPVVQVRMESAHFALFCDVAARLRIPIVDVSAAQSEVQGSIPLHNLPDWNALRHRLQDEIGPTVQFMESMAVVSVVGEYLAPYGLPKLLSVLLASGIEATSILANPLRLSAVIQLDACATAERALHAAFCSRPIS